MPLPKNAIIVDRQSTLDARYAFVERHRLAQATMCPQSTPISPQERFQIMRDIVALCSLREARRPQQPRGRPPAAEDNIRPAEDNVRLPEGRVSPAEDKVRPTDSSQSAEDFNTILASIPRGNLPPGVPLPCKRTWYIFC